MAANHWTGQLPTPRDKLRAAVVNNILYVTGGYHFDGGPGPVLTSILSWNPSTKTWQSADELAVARYKHAAVAVPSAILSSECSEIF